MIIVRLVDAGFSDNPEKLISPESFLTKLFPAAGKALLFISLMVVALRFHDSRSTMKLANKRISNVEYEMLNVVEDILTYSMIFQYGDYRVGKNIYFNINIH